MQIFNNNIIIQLNRVINKISANIYLWWCDNEGIYNFGDELNPYIISKLTGKKINKKKTLWKRFQIRRIYIGIGSVIENANKNTIVWGAGIIYKDQQIRPSIYKAVRGPLTQQRMIECGLKPPTTIGDPALLLPTYYTPKIIENYKIGIIPHIVDYDLIKTNFNNSSTVNIIDFTAKIEPTVDLIASCEIIISSSLHGIIVANAYGIPAIWCGFSDKLTGDDIKFKDYFLSVEITEKIEKVNISPNLINIELIKKIVEKGKIIKPKDSIIQKIQSQLIENHPF